MSALEENLKGFIDGMKKDIQVTEDFLGDDSRMGAVVSCQKAMVAEIEELMEDSKDHAM